MARCPRCGADLLRSAAPLGDLPSLELDDSELGIPTAQPKRPPAPHNPRPAPLASRAPQAPTTSRAPQAVSRAPAARPITSAAPPRIELGSLDPSIDLDISRPSGAPLPARLAAENTGLRLGADGQLVAPKPARPAGTAVAGLDEDGLDPYEIRAYADFGDPPTAFYLTPLYAFRVRQRRAELRRELADRNAAIAAAEEKIEDAVVAFAERVRPIAAQNPLYQRALAPIEDVERLLMARDAALGSELDTYKRTTTTIDGQIHALEKELHGCDEQAAAIDANVAKLTDARKRAEARVKRAEIEIRNAEQAIAAGDARGASLQVHLAEQVHERDSQAAEAERLTPLILAEAKLLDAPRQQRFNIERHLEGLRHERAEAEQRLKRQTGTREAGVQDARKRLRAVTADFGRVALGDAKTFGGDFRASRMLVESLLREKGDKEQRVLLVEKAMRTADEAVVKRGIIVTVVAVIAFLLLFVGLPMYRVMTPAKPPPLYPVDE